MIRSLFAHYETYNAHGRLAHLKYAGVVGTIGYPLFYLIYVAVLHQPYENLPIRLVATAGCIGLALQAHWPEKWRPWYIAYSWWVFLYLLPFFHVFMALKNHGGMVMIADNFMAVFFLVLLTDWRNTIAMILFGGTLAILLYLATTPDPSVPMEYVQRLPTFILVVIGGSLFKSSEKQMAAKLEEEKLRGMSTALATVVHEMRTPLGSVRADARGLRRYVATLVGFYDRHRDLADEADHISPKHLDMTIPAIDRIAEECRYMNSVLDLLLANAIGKTPTQKIGPLEIVSATAHTVDTYPYENPKLRALVSTDFQYAFTTNGNEDQLRMVLLNLIKNAFKAIARARKGALVISTEKDANGRGASLKVRDTACGVPPAQLPRIFERFYTWPPSEGTGIGLAFCREVLTSWGATISCVSEEGVFTEFVIHFPRAEAAGNTLQASTITSGMNSAAD